MVFNPPHAPRYDLKQKENEAKLISEQDINNSNEVEGNLIQQENNENRKYTVEELLYKETYSMKVAKKRIENEKIISTCNLIRSEREKLLLRKKQINQIIEKYPMSDKNIYSLREEQENLDALAKNLNNNKKDLIKSHIKNLTVADIMLNQAAIGSIILLGSLYAVNEPDRLANWVVFAGSCFASGIAAVIADDFNKKVDHHVKNLKSRSEY